MSDTFELVDRIVSDLQQYDIEIRKVHYEFQINGNEMMRISKRNNNKYQ